MQYPWNAPSPRPALAGFAGLYLVPNRVADARSLLLALVPRLRDGLLPTEFPEDGSEPVYAGADVALWFVNAVYQYLAYTGDAPTVRRHLLECGLRDHRPLPAAGRTSASARTTTACSPAASLAWA